MADYFPLLLAALSHGDAPPSPASDAPAIYHRLHKAWAAPCGVADLSVLLRHVLRHESERQGGGVQFLTLPLAHRSAAGLAATAHLFGLGATPQEQTGKLRLHARPWYPQWLGQVEETGKSFEAAAFAEEPRRLVANAEGDPFLSAFGRQTYLSAGQKAAVRAVLTMPPGATLLVNLPTGGGKSLCAQVLATNGFVGEESGGLTVVVVPTVALCLDQARAMRELGLVPHECAYYSGMDETERKALWGRTADGSQRILFTSPESLTQSLRPALYIAARRGALRALVIDEAHIVEQWGDEFRPAFQELAGLRRGLMREAAQGAPHAPRLRTLLLSATLTPSAVDTLTGLFGQPGPVTMASAVQLRPEPALWLAPCQAGDLERARKLQEARVLDAIRHLPRPLILYTTRVDDAKRWKKRLSDEGFSRLDAMTGETPAARREQIIQRWSRAELDIVVATSAFGLGIDQSDVRSVVHACVPETLDRYYQEVGRGGRDGNASLGLMIYTEVANLSFHRKEKDDLILGRGIGKKRIISVDLGLNRWKRIFDTNEPLGDSLFRVALDVSPGLNKRYIDMHNTKNTAWNARTLTLMSRAGLIELDDEPPREPKTASAVGIGEVGAADTLSKLAPSAARDEKFPVSRVVRLLDPDRHSDEARWHELVEPARVRTASAVRVGWKGMLELLRARRCTSEVFSAAYNVSSRVGLNDASATVAPSCGGCPFCRAHNIAPFTHPAVPARWVWPPQLEVRPSLRALMGNSQLLVIFYNDRAEEKDLLPSFRTLLRWMVAEGIACLAASPEQQRSLVASETALLRSRPIFLAPHDRPGEWPRVPTLLFQPPDEELRHYNVWLRRHDQPRNYEPLVALLPERARHPERPDRSLREMVNFPQMSLTEWQSRTGQ